ncbi:MAG: hypothetical protein ACRDNL_26005, partial [Spirillospora sp.]
MGMGQLARLGLAEGLLIVLPGAVLGPLLAPPLLRLAAHAPTVRDSGLRLDAVSPAPLWIVAVATALICAVVLTVPTLRGANRTFVEAQAGIGRTGRLRGSGADLALLLVAGLAIWQLTRYGADGAGGGNTASGIDPFIVSGPALALLAGGVLLLRLVPVTSRIAERAATRGRGFVTALGTRQVGRRRLRYAGPVLLLVMAMAVGVLSVTTMSTWRRSQTEQADFQAAADLRVTRATAPESPTPLGQAGRVAALPGVTGTTAVLRTEADLGDASATILAADTGALGPVLRVQPGLQNDLRLDELAKARPAFPGLTVPGKPQRLLLDLKLGHAGPVPGKPANYKPPADTQYKIAVTVADARGLVRQVPLPGLLADGRAHTLALDASTLAGPGGVLSYPLSVRGLHYSYDDNIYSGPLDLELLHVRGDGTGEAAPPAGARWDAFVQPSDSRPGARAETAAGALTKIAIESPPGWASEGDTFEAIGTVNALLATGQPTPRGGAAGTNTDLLPLVPGVITEETARRAHVGVGGKVTVGTVDGQQPVKVVGIAPALPSVPPGEPGILVDLPTLTGTRLAAGGTAPASIVPGEWWTSARDGRTGPAARSLSGHP